MVTMEMGRGMKAALTIIVRIGAEEMSKQVRIPRRVARPHIPDLVTQRIGYEFVFWSLHYVIRTHVWRLSIWVFGCVELLGGEKTEMLTPEEPAESGGVVTCFIRLAIHGAVEVVLIFHDDGEFTVMNTELRLCDDQLMQRFPRTRQDSLYH